MKYITNVIIGKNGTGTAESVYQYSYGITLRISNVQLPTAVEVQFSLHDTRGESIPRIGLTQDGVTDVIIPDSMLENGDATEDYNIFAWVYVRGEKTGTTEYKIVIPVLARAKPEAFDRPEEAELFRAAIDAVNESARRAETAGVEARSWAIGGTGSRDGEDTDNARYYAQSAAESAETVSEKEHAVSDAETAVSKLHEEVVNLSSETSKNAENAAQSATDAENSSAVASASEQEAIEAAGRAARSESAAAESEKTATAAATAAEKSASAASSAQQRSEAAQAAAEKSASAAATSESNASVSKTAAAQSAKAAAESEKAAGASADAASASEQAATTAAQQTAADRQATETASAAAQQAASAASEAQQSIQASAEQIETNKTDIATLKEDVASTKGVTDTIDERIIEAFFGSMRNGKVYQTELYLIETNPTSNGIKTLANKDMVCEPSTDTVEGRDDYEGIGIFSWYNCNYITDDYGRKIPTAIEGWGNGYKNDGSVDVGVIAMTPYWNVAEKDGKQIWTLSDTPNNDYGLIPWETAKKEDGTYASYVIHSKYVSGIGTDGLLRSFSGSKPARNQSYNNMIDNYQKKGKGCWGAGKERDMYVILYDVIKYATKNEQTIFKGTTNYSLQYSASVQRNTKETYFPVTNEQASNIIVGSYASVGYGSKNADDTVSNDRGSATIHKYADDAKVIRIETIDENNKAVYLDIEDGFATTPVALSDTVNAQIMLSTMHWWSGTTDKVIGKHDGSPISNTDGKHPFRVMGIECAVGGYIVYADSVMALKEDYSKDVYIAPRGVKHIKDEATIKNTYKLIGNIPGNDGNDFWIGDIRVDVETCSWAAKTIGGSDSQGWGDRCYAGGKNTSGTREDLGRGNLWTGSNAGSVCVGCWDGLGGMYWNFLGCD